MKTMRQTITSILVGIGIGLSVNSTFLAYYGMQYEFLSGAIIVRSYIASLMIGVISALSTKIFKRDELSLLQQTVLHYIIILIIVCSVGKWANWTENTVPFFGIFTVVYIVIYLVCYQIGKRNVDEINHLLKKKSHR